MPPPLLCLPRVRQARYLRALAACLSLLPLLGPAATADFPAPGLVLHLSVDALAGLASGSALSSGWLDQSTEGHHALPGVPPIYLTDVGDGRPAVRFNGINQVLQVDLELGPAATVFLVYASRRNPLLANREEILLAAPGAAPRLALASTGFSDPAPDYPTFFCVDGSSLAAATWVDGRSTRDATGDNFPGRFSVASAVFTAMPPTAALLLGAADLAGTQASKNDVREVLIYNRALTPAERRAVERTLALNHDLEIVTGPIDDPLEAYNLVLGSQQFGSGYGFGQSSNRILNAARQIYRQGGRVFKTRLSNRYAGDDDFSPQSGINSLATLAQHPEFQELLDLPIPHFLFWVSSFSVPSWQNRTRAVGVVPEANWLAFYGPNRALYAANTYTDPAKAPSEFQGLDPASAQNIYREVYDLTVHLLQTYSGTGKSFYLGNWEGDWMLSGTGSFVNQAIPPERLQAMIDWANTRQRAINDAKAATPHEQVNVWFYLEMNKADWMRDGLICVANTVVPALDQIDFISVSSYSVHKASNGGNAPTARVHSDLDRIQAAITPKAHDPAITGSRVIIGEYGFQRTSPFSDQNSQALADILTVRQYLTWPGGTLRFILIWQFYDDAANTSGTLFEFAQIGSLNARRPLYYVHENFYRHARRWLADRLRQDGVLPSAEAFEVEAAHFLASVSLTDYRPVAPFTRFQDWVSFNFPDHLDRANALVSGPAALPDRDGTPNLLRYALGLNRTAAPSRHLPTLEDRAGGKHFVFPFSVDRSDLFVVVEQSTGLQSWGNILFDSREDTPTPEQGRIAVPVPATATTPSFQRLRVGQLP